MSVEDLGGAEAEPSALGWIVFPFFDEGAETRLEPAGGAEAVFRFTESLLNLHAWGHRALILIRELLDAVPVSRLVIGSAEDAADLVFSAAPNIIEGVSA